MVDQEDLAAITATGVAADNSWIERDGLVIGGRPLARYGPLEPSVRIGSSDHYPRQESISGIGGAVLPRSQARYSVALRFRRSNWLPILLSTSSGIRRDQLYRAFLGRPWRTMASV